MVTHIKFYFWIGKELIGRKEIVRWSVAGGDQRDFLRSISITFHNLGNIADGKLSKFSLKTRSNLYDFVLFGSAKDFPDPKSKFDGNLSRGSWVLNVWTNRQIEFTTLLYIDIKKMVFLLWLRNRNNLNVKTKTKPWH